MGRGGVEQLTYDQLLTSTYTTVSIIIQLLIFMYSVYERAKTFQVRIWRESQSPYHLKKTYFLKFTLWFTTNIPRSVISKHKYHSDIPSFEKKTLRIWAGPLDREHNSLFHWHIMYFYVWRGEGTILNFKAFSGYIVTVITISKETSYMSKMTFNTFLVNTNN